MKKREKQTIFQRHETNVGTARGCPRNPLQGNLNPMTTPQTVTTMRATFNEETTRPRSLRNRANSWRPAPRSTNHQLPTPKVAEEMRDRHPPRAEDRRKLLPIAAVSLSLTGVWIPHGEDLTADSWDCAVTSCIRPVSRNPGQHPPRT